MVGDEICGAVVSIRPNVSHYKLYVNRRINTQKPSNTAYEFMHILYRRIILSLWNRTASDHEVTTRIRDTLTRVLSLPPNTVMEYKNAYE